MLQKCSLLRVFRVFAEEPMKIHYVKEISRKIGLAHTSVKKHLNELEKEELILRKQGDIFKGYISNRDSRKFLFNKSLISIRC